MSYKGKFSIGCNGRFKNESGLIPLLVYLLIACTSSPLAPPLLHFEPHREKTSLSNAEKEKILPRELFRGESRLRFHRIVPTRASNIDEWRSMEVTSPRLPLCCCTSASSCSHRKLGNRLLGWGVHTWTAESQRQG